jgi:predicted Zn-dependent protease
VAGRLDDARKVSDRLLELHPDDWRALVARAEVEAAAGDELAALRWLRSAVQRQPDEMLRARYTRLLDHIYEQVRTDLADRRYAEARALCQKIAEIAPEEITARLTAADTYRLAGDLPHAIAAIEALYAERPHDRAVVQRLASLLDMVGDPQRAAYFKKLLLELPATPKDAAR